MKKRNKSIEVVEQHDPYHHANLRSDEGMRKHGSSAYNNIKVKVSVEKDSKYKKIVDYIFSSNISQITAEEMMKLKQLYKDKDLDLLVIELKNMQSK